MADIITTAGKLNCVERELNMRKRVYTRWVDDGKMSAGRARDRLHGSDRC